MSRRMAKHTLMVLAPLLGSAGFAQPGSAERREGQRRGVSRIREEGGRELQLPSRRQRKTAAVSSGVGPVLHGPRGTGRLRRRLHLDGRREAGGGDRGLPVLHEGPPPGRSVPLAVARQADRRTGSAVVWSPARPGVEFKPIPGSPAPADSAAWRLRQMRGLRGSSPAARPTARGWTTAMRLLSQPLYRYEDTKGDLIDGGLFVFVHGAPPRSSC